MASVRMTNELRELITHNYRKQCQAAFDKDFDVESTMRKIVEDRQRKAGEDFRSLLNSARDFQQKLMKHEQAYEPIFTKRYSNTYGSLSRIHEPYSSSPITHLNEIDKQYYPLKKLDKMHIVCNRNRPMSQNFDYIQDWRGSYKGRWDDKINPPTDTWQEGDLYFMHTFETPVDFPVITHGDDASYDSTEDFAPSLTVGLVVSDPDMCDKLEQIPMAKQKTSDMVAKFKDFIDPITTLKKFLDDFPGGRSLVPTDKLQAMAAPAKKREVKAKVQPKDLLTPTMKQEFNEVMLESSLLGGNND